MPLVRQVYKPVVRAIKCSSRQHPRSMGPAPVERSRLSSYQPALAPASPLTGHAPVERSRLSSYQPSKQRFPRPNPETSLPLARSEAATLPGLLQGTEFAGRSMPWNSRPVPEARGQAGSVRPRNVPFEGDLGGLGRRTFAFVGSCLVDFRSTGAGPIERGRFWREYWLYLTSR